MVAIVRFFVVSASFRRRFRNLFCIYDYCLMQINCLHLLLLCSEVRLQRFSMLCFLLCADPFSARLTERRAQFQFISVNKSKIYNFFWYKMNLGAFNRRSIFDLLHFINAHIWSFFVYFFHKIDFTKNNMCCSVLDCDRMFSIAHSFFALHCEI